jgi:hypothetical protein
VNPNLIYAFIYAILISDLTQRQFVLRGFSALLTEAIQGIPYGASHGRLQGIPYAYTAGSHTMSLTSFKGSLTGPGMTSTNVTPLPFPRAPECITGAHHTRTDQQHHAWSEHLSSMYPPNAHRWGYV